ncbi:MAG: YkvA family protein [Parahaliea sp.]
MSTTPNPGPYNTGTPRENEAYEDSYNEENYWQKLKNYARIAGHELVEKSLMLHYAAQRKETPAWARATIYGALGYFIAPVDAIFDMTPAAGYADDLGVIVLAVATVSHFINDEVRQKASEKASRWFGLDLQNEEKPLKS